MLEDHQKYLEWNGDRFRKWAGQRTAVDWAEEIRYLVDVSYPDRDKIILVMDNLNTHALSSLYKAFPAPEVRRIARKLEIHYIPKHGSWLDMAEIELNVMTRQCLSVHII